MGSRLVYYSISLYSYGCYYVICNIIIPFLSTQFLGRQRRLKEGDSNEEKWGEIDETLHKYDQKFRDSGRPVHGTKKVKFRLFFFRFHLHVIKICLNVIIFLLFIQVANLATKFVKKEEPNEEADKATSKEEVSYNLHSYINNMKYYYF